MPWSSPAQGPFVDWQAQPLDRVDPYLVWAAATGFADYGGAPTGRVPALVELQAGQTGRDLQLLGGDTVVVPPAYASARVCAVAIGEQFAERCRTDAALGAIVERVELGLPLADPRAAGGTLPAIAGPVSSSPGAPTPQAPSSGGPVVLGVIDDGCAFAHPSLRAPAGPPWTTRVRALWDQNTLPGAVAFGSTGTAPPEFGYGREVTKAQLDAWLTAATRGGVLDEDSCYRAAGYRALRRRATHGMHVLDLACGPVPPSQRLNGRRPVSLGPVADEVVFVQLPTTALNDPSGGWLANQVLDGIRYVLARAPADASRVVVNVSFGSRVGPHDGTSTLECAILELLATDERLHVVLPAGNFFRDRAHAVVTLAPGGRASLEAVVPPGSRLPVFVELWLPADGDDVSVAVVPPQQPGEPSPAITAGHAFVWPSALAPACTVVFPQRSALGQRGTCVLIAIAPTQRFEADRPKAPAGRWRFELTAGAALTDAVDVRAYVARSDADFGMRRQGGRPYFVPDAAYAPHRHLRSPGDDVHATAGGTASNVRRRGTLAWAAVHPRLHIVGGSRLRTSWATPTPEQWHAPYASAGPSAAPSSGWQAPTEAFPSDESVVLAGVRAAATRGGGTVRLVGTSASAPQRARVLLGGTTPPTRGAAAPSQDTAFFGAGRRSAP